MPTKRVAERTTGAALVPLPRPTEDVSPTTTRGSATSTSGADPRTSALSCAASTTRSTSTGSAPSGRGSRRSRPTAGRCWSPITPRPSRPTPRRSCTASKRNSIDPSTAWPTTGSRACRYVGTMWARGGGVAADPENAYRLLREQKQLALVFPEGSKGTSKTYGERYQLRRFGRGGFVEIAMRAGVPIVPIAVVGAEESMPILAKNGTLAKMFGLPYFPHHGQQLVFGPLLGGCCLLPGQVQAARARPRPLRRARRPGAVLEEPRDGRGRPHPRQDARGAVRHAAHALVGLVRLIVWASAYSSPASAAFWGGRAAEALEARPRRRDDRRPRHRRAEGRTRAHRIRARRLELLDPRPHRGGHAGRHDPAHVPRDGQHPHERQASCTRST